MAIPIKKTQSRLVSYLSVEEMKSLLNGPDPNTRAGIRDRGMLQLAVEAGLRVSELVHLRLDDVSFQPSPHIWCEVRAGGNANFHCARTPRRPCGLGLPSEERRSHRNSFSTRAANP
jgi:integrase